MTSLWLDRAPLIETDQFEAGQRFDEIIIGGGITGLVSALLFARAGRRVAVVEARRVGSVTTGNTTAKLSVLQGVQLQRVQAYSYRKILEAYVEANLEGLAWMCRYADDHGIPIQRKDSVSYAATREGVRTVNREYDVAKSVGLPVRRATDVGLPFETHAAVVLPDQAQFDPMDVLATLAADIRSHGGRIFEDVRVARAKASDPVKLFTNKGQLLGKHVIVATGIPVLDRGLYFAKVKPGRSYALSYRVPGELPPAMYMSVDDPKRSVRTTPSTDGDLLIIGGNGHTVGRHPSPKSQVDDLEQWTQQHWPGAERTHVWSAQDYETPHKVPFVGWMPRGRGRIYLATGYDKWGMTNSVQCALTLAADILGGHLPWAATLHRRVTTPRAWAWGVGYNAGVAAEFVKGYATALLRKLPDHPPEEGQAFVGRQGVLPTGISTVNGVACRVSTVCTHQHAILSWNDLEHSWDCPAHGSRFDADGTVLEGPAKRNLHLRQ
jgi:glycine/D-amino acid oxidase-like deaminating enzyme/nitrite reductase/ring-hydroxylating ferredoxin subunit